MSPPPLPGAGGGQLRERALAAGASAQLMLGAEPDPEAAIDPERLRALIEALAERLSELGAGDPRGAVAHHDAAVERLHARFQGRFDALGRVRAAIDALRQITAPAAMLAAAPVSLCGATMLRAALLSCIGGGRMVAEAAHFTGDPERAAAVLGALRADPIALEHPLIETELLRRRRATIVDGAAVHPRVQPRLVALTGWSSYAAAPIVVGSAVIGVLHAARGPGERLDVLDRDVLWEFANGLAQAYESASLRRTLRDEREQMRRFLEWIGARSGELTDAPVRLATIQRLPRAPAPAVGVALNSAGRDDRVVFEGLLTRRELDVLRLVADGHSNRAIAQALVISDGTVKFHVNGILRKLRVANRAEAVSRYLRLLGMSAP
jgi:DNA-binding CsgD family transcriptional regulator